MLLSFMYLTYCSVITTYLGIKRLSIFQISLFNNTHILLCEMGFNAVELIHKNTRLSNDATAMIVQCPE